MRRPSAHLEADVLASAIRDPDLNVRKLLSLLEEEDFDSDTTKPVFIAISNVAKVGGHKAVTYSTVHDELRRMGADTHDALNLLDPDLGLGSVGSFEPKCRRLREIRQERMMQQGMGTLMEQSWETPQQLIDAVAELRDNAIMLSPTLVPAFGDVLDELVDVVEYDDHHEEYRVKTGLPTLDSFLHGGIKPGQLVVIGARTGVGKTTFAVQIAARAASVGHRVLFFSIEESPVEVAERLVRLVAKVPSDLRKRDSEPLIAAAFREDLRGLPVMLPSEYRLDGILNLIQDQVIEQDAPGLVVVDYAGLVQVAGHYDSRVQELGEVTRQLKVAAREFRVPVLLLAQVNRSPMARKDSRPQLSDLRESGSLEQDADIVIFLHHDEHSGEASLRLAKQRRGPTGDLAVRFDYPVGRIDELSHLGGDHG